MSKVLADQITKLEEEHKQLLRQRKTVLRSLAAIRKSQRYFKSQDDAGSPSKAGQVIRKKRKLDDGTVQQEPVIQHKQSGNEKFKVNHPAQPNLPQQIQQRFKRIMGSMSKHLTKAKSTLQNEQSKAKRKAELEMEAIQLQQKNVMVAKDQKRALIAKTKETETKKKQQLAKALLEVENSILEANYKYYLSQIDGFIITKTQPPIYWKPVGKSEAISKLMAATKATQKLQEESVSKIIHSVKQPIQYRKSQVFMQNQTDFLSNLGNEYYGRLSNYIVTETKPPIFWVPIKLNDHLSKQLSKTQDYVKVTTSLMKQRQEQLKETLVKPKNKESSEEEVSDSQHD